MPKISVIIPAYNAEKTIAETIKSTQNQTFKDFDLLVINDGSTDKTVDVVESIKDSRLRLFSFPNSGVSVARNRGIDLATGEYIAFLDADDLWTNDKLERQLLALKTTPEAGIAYSRTYYIDEGGNFLHKCGSVSFEGNVFKHLLISNFLINGSNPLIRQQAIKAVGKFDSFLNYGEDWDYYLRLAALYPFVVVPKYQVLYRKTSFNSSSNVEKMKQACLTVLERTYKDAPSNLQHFRNQSLNVLYLYCADLHFYNSHNNPQEIDKVGENLLISIRLRLTSLLKPNTQRLLIKFILRKLICI